MSLEITQKQKEVYYQETGINIDPITEQEINSVAKYAKSIGLTFTFDKNPEQIEYCNNICYLSQSSYELDLVEFMIHNLCHYIVASPSRREMADFGLGNSPDTHNYEVERYTSSLVAELEERLTIKLTSYFFKFLKIRNEPSLIQKQHAFNYDVEQILVKMNVLDSNKQLTHKLRAISDEEIYSK